MSKTYLFKGDCLEVMDKLIDKGIKVDAIITDPPYGLSFMNKKWDYDVPKVEIWEKALQVLKPGGHLLAFAGTRTQHRMAVNIEDAGFEIRDMLAWVYGSGFPKSYNISKAIDKKGGENLSWFIDYILQIAEKRGITKKELTMLFPSKNGNPTGWLWNKQHSQSITLEQYNKIKDFLDLPFDNIAEAQRKVIGKKQAGLGSGQTYAFTDKNKTAIKDIDITTPTTNEAKKWDGWGTALKPALEPITLARKPLSEKTVADNVLKYGTGGINIDACRVPIDHQADKSQLRTLNRSNRTEDKNGQKWGMNKKQGDTPQVVKEEGRFPANFIHDGSNEVIELFPNSKSTQGKPRTATVSNQTPLLNSTNVVVNCEYDNQCSASRFFYCAKASKKERTLNNTLSNNHPTVKPIKLMEYLIKLICPNDGIVLDPFMGSGTTGVACKNLNRKFIGIELGEEYFKIAKERIK